MSAFIKADYETVDLSDANVGAGSLVLRKSGCSAFEYMLKYIIEEGWGAKPTAMTVADTMAYNGTPKGHKHLTNSRDQAHDPIGFTTT